MSFSGLLVQLLNGLASASSLFLVSAGLSLIFGVMRIVNFAHGSFFMLGIYVAYSLVEHLGAAIGFWPALLLAPLATAALGALVEVVLLRRIYRAPELFQLLATFALVLVIKDAVLWAWGPEELFGPRAPGLEGAVEILGRQFPTYDLFLMAVGPLVLGLLWLGLHRTRWGTLVRAATQDRGMVGALGVNQAWLFTGVFALGALLAGLAGALQLPREPAQLDMDLNTIGAAFVVVVVGGMGSIPGAFVAALLIAELKAVCVWAGLVEVGGISLSLSKMTLVVEFLVMAVVLVWRPWGLLGQPQPQVHAAGVAEAPLHPASRGVQWLGWAVLAALALVPLLAGAWPYAPVLLVDLLVAVLFASACISSWGRRACTRLAMPPISGWGPMRRLCWCSRPGCAWKWPCCWHRWPQALRRWCMAGSVCGCRACTSPCSRWRLRRSPGRCATSGTPLPAAATALPACGPHRGWPANRPITS